MLKKLLVPVVMSGAVVGALALGPVASAGASAPTPPSQLANTGANAGKGAARTWLKNHRRELRRAGVTISATTIGITPQALAADLKAGSSVADVAGQHHVSAATVVGALDSAATAKVNQAVGNHRLTQARATKIEAGLPGLLTTWVNHTF